MLPKEGNNVMQKDYLSALISGPSDALSASPLGNAYFMNTNSQCYDVDSGDLQDRYMFISNITYADVQFPSRFMGFTFNETKGLLPGIINNIKRDLISNIGRILQVIQGSYYVITRDVLGCEVGPPRLTGASLYLASCAAGGSTPPPRPCAGRRRPEARATRLSCT